GTPAQVALDTRAALEIARGELAARWPEGAPPALRALLLEEAGLDPAHPPARAGELLEDLGLFLLAVAAGAPPARELRRLLQRAAWSGHELGLRQPPGGRFLERLAGLAGPTARAR
ncbi:MAG TPA: hypothetical protein DEA08_32705, partial [Planctomycetes bacterium]|nr:hypothetical protein [Planctomycetota bacterium]